MTMSTQNQARSAAAVVVGSRAVRMLHSSSGSGREISDSTPSVSHGKTTRYYGKSLKQIAGRVGLYAAVALICIYSFFPIYWMILSSLRSPEKLFLDSSLVFWPPDLSSYKSLLQLTNYPANFVNSVMMAMATIAVATTLSSFIAYGATRLRFRGKTTLVASMLFAYMFPPLMLVIPMSALFRIAGLADSLWGLLIAHLAISLPLAVWLLWGFFKSMPFDLEEAAMVDGCSQFGAFIKVVLPLSAPGLITVGIFSFLLSWADYVFALILIMSDDRKTLPVGLASMLGAQDLRWGEILAGATLIALPLFVIFMFCYRYFVAGLTAGALKG
ncbi:MULTISPECIES: carbohydrate ABC transporter permease [Hyphomicrobiales]|jgi:multiple sugar transport system permease protein|nr:MULTISPECIES: carbohydrate ABC transporter permease [Hyphomicrobiales]MCC8430149.1 carbohydrate ABC transporter permease [Reyranella aquatilis]MCG2641232.1 carbohydrate ABC transporter permease [Bradyrhizobium zhengyangense]MCI1272460.1 carbohydrate ABC transporter permease [Sphingobium sp.]